MKTITIPQRFGYPTVGIIANGKEYTLNSGVEITVEDHIAEIIENAIALAPKIGVAKSKLAELVEGSISEIDESDLQGIKDVKNYAFYNCDNLVKISIPNGVENIVGYAFSHSAKLKEVILPESIISIDGRAFTEDNGLKVTLKALTPPSIQNGTTNIPTTCIFKVPSKSLEAYKSAASWSAIANQIVAIEE